MQLRCSTGLSGDYITSLHVTFLRQEYNICFIYEIKMVKLVKLVKLVEINSTLAFKMVEIVELDCYIKN